MSWAVHWLVAISPERRHAERCASLPTVSSAAGASPRTAPWEPLTSSREGWEPMVSSAGSPIPHSGSAMGQRGAKVHPVGRSDSEGGLPLMGTSAPWRSMSMRGTAPSRPMV